MDLQCKYIISQIIINILQLLTLIIYLPEYSDIHRGR